MDPGTFCSRQRELDAKMRIVRECLEGVMEPRTATAAILDAMGELGQWGELAEPERFDGFIVGPLRLAVSARLGSLAAADVTDRIEAMLAIVRSREAPPTREVPFADGPVRVLLLGGTTKLGVTLRNAIGGAGIALGHAANLAAARTMVARLEPELVVIDAADPPQANVADLLLLLTELPRETGIVVFGSEQPWGARVLRTRMPSEPRLVPFDRSSGVAPLVDLVRSRRAA
jgi:hypothetical protein